MDKQRRPTFDDEYSYVGRVEKHFFGRAPPDVNDSHPMLRSHNILRNIRLLPTNEYLSDSGIVTGYQNSSR